MALICGMEEAGRGPLIGPLVMCGLVVDEKDEKKLVELGVKDSKQLTAKQREKMFDEILKISKAHKIILLSPSDVDLAVESDSNNLNWLEAQTTAKILNELNADKAIIDCPSTNIPAYTNYLQKLLKVKTRISCAHHADVDFPIVSASSIIAKVTRDAEVDKLKKKYNVDFGSGYMADPKTKDFLDKNWNKYPELFRHSWVPYKKLIEGLKQIKLEEF